MDESEVGRKDDEGKPRFDLIPEFPLEELARLYGIGAAHYGDYNWRKGMAWSRIYAAMMRHLYKWKRSIRFDDDTGCEHLSSVIWGAMTLMEYERLGIGEDDRPSSMDVTPAYVAGLVDADGSISIGRSKSGDSYQYYVQISVAQTRREAVDRLARKYGGKIHTYDSLGENTAPKFEWVCPRQSAPQLLTDALPFFALKHEQAILALELWSQIKAGNKPTKAEIEELEQIYQQAAAMNARGRDAWVRRYGNLNAIPEMDRT